jgi:hypothetical protein
MIDYLNDNDSGEDRVDLISLIRASNILARACLDKRSSTAVVFLAMRKSVVLRWQVVIHIYNMCLVVALVNRPRSATKT